MEFTEFFQKATAGNTPFPYQRRFAESSSLPQIVCVPTGLGKTAMVVIGWLWRRFGGNQTAKEHTPMRLVYCLPMRVLVEQILANARTWLCNLREAGALEGNGPLVHVLMGGEDENDWDLHPDQDAMLVGTQDMLLSRSLNRGYAVSRSRWPIQFGLLHTDCLWVFDEIQLMGAGLATAAQLEAFRTMLPARDAPDAQGRHRCRSVWMSATMQRDWLKTVDFRPYVDKLTSLELTREDFHHDEVRKRWHATRPLKKAKAQMGATRELAKEVCQAHRPGTRTIIIVNTVKRACEVFEAIAALNRTDSRKSRKKQKKQDTGGKANAPAAGIPRVVLLHSRFRPQDRNAHVKEALAEIGRDEPGTIVVSTQVIEAGVDVSAATLFTELAPWASLVQRFGRCNRRGEDSAAQAFWVDLADMKTEAERLALPYPLHELAQARNRLANLNDVGLGALPSATLPFEHSHVIRRKDLIELFDTTPDLAGNDIDIDRFVREVEDSDVRLFWRDYRGTPNGDDEVEQESGPRRDELCPAPLGSKKHPGFRQFVEKHQDKVWRWNFLDKRWERAEAGRLAPGQVFLIHADAGGYSPCHGWEERNTQRVEPVESLWETSGEPPDATEDERLSRVGVWRTIAHHTEEVSSELKEMAGTLAIGETEAEALRHAARWHDRGKAHFVFQNAIDDGQCVQRQEMTRRRERPKEWRGCRFVAKAPGIQWGSNKIVDRGFWRRYDWMPGEGRKHFRHELASALAVLMAPETFIPPAQRDLVAYLVAAHHGKVRLSIRSLPTEMRPRDNAGKRVLEKRFARGIWDGDELPETDLGSGVTAPAVTLSLAPMELGLSDEEPFVGHPSWAERMIQLRETFGPFRLAYLEAILRAADIRASEKAEIA